MQQATQLELSPSGQSSYRPKPIPNLQDKAGTLACRETLQQKLDMDKSVPRHVPRLRAVVGSQAFKNILVDEMDMMLSRAATLIQASWRGYRLRQKLTSQVLAAKGIQEAWRRFSTRRLLRSGKAVEKKSSVDEGDIPYHPPQQVRFQHSKEGGYLLAPPVMVNKETQFPSADSLATCALLQPPGIPQPDTQAPCATGGSSITFLPHQTVSIRLPSPVSLNAKCHPCLLTRTIRSASFVHIEGDMMKTKQVTARANKAEAPGPLKTQTQARVEADVLKVPSQTGQAPVMTKSPLQPCLVPTIAMTKTPPQRYPAAAVTKTPLQSCLASIMNKTLPQPCPAPMAVTAKTPSQLDPTAPVAKTTFQSSLATILNKIPTQPCPVPETITKTPPQPCPTIPMTKTQAQMRPIASVTNTAPQTRTAAMTSIIKPPPQTCQVPVMAKTLPQMRPAAAPMARTPLQTCPVATMAKTPSQTLPGASMTKTPTQTRLAAMITKTPAQLRSVATLLRNLCLPPPADGNLKASPPAVVTAGIPNTSSHTNLNRPKAKAVVTERQMAGMAKVSSHTQLTEGKVKYCPPPHLGAGAPKAPARPFLEAEKIKALSQKQVKTETTSNTSVAKDKDFSQKQVKIATMSNTNVAKDRSKILSQAHLMTDAMNVQSQVYMPVETAVVLPQAQLSTCPATALPQAQMATCSTTTSPQRPLLTEQTTALPQANVGPCLSKPPPEAHPPAKLTKAPSLAHLGTCLTKTQSQAHLTTGVIKVQPQANLPTGLTKAQSQAQLVTETAKCLSAAHQAAELSSKTQSQPLLAGLKASTQPCQPSLGTLSQAKTEDRLTQLPAHSHAQGEATQGPCQGASKSMLVPLLASTGHPTCNIKSWGNSGATLAQPSTTSPAVPCQEELGASQLASLCAELAAGLGSQEDIRALLAKAVSQGEVRAALNQALSKEVLVTKMAKALPKSMLGTALVKALSWGELATALSCALSRGELRAELTKAMQGKLVDVLNKALTEEERAALSQNLCQGELGSVLSQSLSQAALRTGLVLPKATSKKLGNGMIVKPAPVEVDYRESPSATWGPTLGRVRPQASKGPVDVGAAGGQTCNSAIPSVAVGPRNRAKAPWKPARCAVQRDAVRGEAAVDPRQLGQLVARVQAVETIVVQAVVIIQACARGYLVRRTIKVWHQWAVIIQAAWRGYCARRTLAQLGRAATIIQAAWRGYCIRRRQAQQMLLPSTWAEVGGRTRSTSDHRCFQSCQPQDCTLCRSLSPKLGSLPSAVMLVGSSPRTCHMCGHTLPTRVVQGMGQHPMGQAGMLWGYDTQLTPKRPKQLRSQNKAATVIQAIWRGFIVRRRLRQQQVAAKMVQATWRGHYTRASLTTDALLGPEAWDNPQNMQWPGV